MTVLQARNIVRGVTRDGPDTAVFPDADVDNAIMYVGRRFCRECRTPITATDVALTADSSAFPVAGALATAGFTADRVIDVTLVDSDGDQQYDALRLVDVTDVRARRSVTENTTGVPVLLAFETPGAAGIVWPTPNEDYTARLRWFAPFTTWTAGSDNATTLNLSDEQMDAVLNFGAPARLYHHRKDFKMFQNIWNDYLGEELRLKKAGKLGVRTIFRDPHENRHRGGRGDEIFNKNNPWIA